MRLNAKSKADEGQTSTQPPPASTEAKSANPSEQAAKSKLDKPQTSTQPPPASTEAKSANTSEQAATEALFEIIQSLRRQELSEKELAQGVSLNLLMRINNFFGQIQEAFSGQPLHPDWPPDGRANQLRLNAYVSACALAIKIFGSAIEVSKAISSMTTTKPTATSANNDL